MPEQSQSRAASSCLTVFRSLHHSRRKFIPPLFSCPSLRWQYGIVLRRLCAVATCGQVLPGSCIAQHLLVALSLLCPVVLAARGNADTVPDASTTPPAAAERLQSLAVDRITLFTQSRADELAAEMAEASRQRALLEQQIKVLGNQLRAANQQAVKLQGLAIGAAGAHLGDAAMAARANANVIQGQFNNAIRSQNVFVQNVFVPVQQRVDKFNKQWANIYRKMRALVPRDRTDPQAKRIVDCLAAITEAEPKFFKGYILAAIAMLHAECSTDEVDACLGEVALHAPPWLNITTSPMCVDLCYASCLAGTPKRVDTIIKGLDKFNAGRRTVEQDWILGIHSQTSGRMNDARKHLNSAATKIQKFNDGVDAPVDPVIIADAVTLMISDDRQRQRARELLEKHDSVKTSGAWQVLRARALMLQDEGRHDEAANFVIACRERAPRAAGAILDDQFAVIDQHGR
jgi:hypothetical protein